MRPLWESLQSVGEKLGFNGEKGSVLEKVFNALGAVIEFISPLYEAFAAILGAVIELIVDIAIAFNKFIHENERAGKVMAGLGAAFKATFIQIKEAAINILGGVGKLITGILSGDFDQIKEGIKSLGKGLIMANPYAAGANAAGAFSKGYKKGLGPATNFFPSSDKQAAAAEAGGTGATGQKAPGAGLPSSSGTTGNLKAGISEVKAGAPKTFNININSLVEALTFNTQTIKESTSEIEDQIKRTLLTVLADAQAIAK